MKGKTPYCFTEGCTALDAWRTPQNPGISGHLWTRTRKTDTTVTNSSADFEIAEDSDFQTWRIPKNPDFPERLLSRRRDSPPAKSKQNRNYSDCFEIGKSMFEKSCVYILVFPRVFWHDEARVWWQKSGFFRFWNPKKFEFTKRGLLSIFSDVHYHEKAARRSKDPAFFGLRNPEKF